VQTEEFRIACERKLDAWVPACGGTETPFKARSGAILLYCFNPATGQHAYIDQGTDWVLTYEEAEAHLQR
jgi:hypothetical protein